MKHERSCLTTFSYIEKRVDNTTRSGVFCAYVLKHCIKYLLYLLNQNLNQGENEDVIYQTRETVLHRDIQILNRELKIRRAAEYF